MIAFNRENARRDEEKILFSGIKKSDQLNVEMLDHF